MQATGGFRALKPEPMCWQVLLPVHTDRGLLWHALLQRRGHFPHNLKRASKSQMSQITLGEPHALLHQPGHHDFTPSPSNLTPHP